MIYNCIKKKLISLLIIFALIGTCIMSGLPVYAISPSGIYSISPINIFASGFSITLQGIDDANYYNIYKKSTGTFVNTVPVPVGDTINSMPAVYGDISDLEVWVFNNTIDSSKLATFLLNSSNRLILNVPSVPIESISLNESTADIFVGQTVQLTAAVNPSYALNLVKWTVVSQTGENIVSVSTQGLVSALKQGSAVIRATSQVDSTKYADCTINVSQAPIVNSTINPTIASFDKNISAQVDIQVTINLNSNTLNDIKNGSAILGKGTDYTVSDNMATLSKNYLATLPAGSTTLTFYFSAGSNAELSITVTDSTPPVIPGGGSTDPGSGGIPGGGGAPIGGGLPIGGGGTPAGGGLPADGGETSNDENDADENNPRNGAITVEPTTSGGIATVEINTDDFKDILESASVIDGIKSLTINVNDAGSKEYDIELPSSALNSTADKSNVIINTAIATITLPSNMFENEDVQGTGSIGINVSDVDKSTLPASVAEKIGNAPVLDINVTVNGDIKTWNNPEAPVTISIPYSLKAGENADNITVFYIDSKGNLINMQGRYDPTTGMVTFTTTHFSKYLIKINEVNFTDLAGFEKYSIYIESMAAKGIIEGVGNNKYAPGKVLTRAEFSKLLVMMLKLGTNDTKNIFIDVKSTDWYAPYVNAAYKAGLIKGIGGNKFAPNDTITVQDAALILVRALKYRGVSAGAGSLSGIKDYKDISNHAKDAVGFTVSRGIIPLDTKHNFNPKGTVNRASAAEYIYNVFNYKN